MFGQIVMNARETSLRNRFWKRGVLPLVYKVLNQPVLEELAFLERSQWWEPRRLEELQLRRLLDLLSYSVRYVPFYRERLPWDTTQYNGAGLAEVLKDMPILEKNEARALGDATMKKTKMSRRYTMRHTAGTSGEPLFVFADSLANARTLAARIRCQRWFGVEMGDRECRLWSRPLGWDSSVIQAMKDLTLNRYRISPPDLEPNRIERTIFDATKARPNYVYGYSSMVIELGGKLANTREREKLSLKAAFLTAESSKPFERERLSTMLGCRVVDEYGCSEVDIIAHQCPEKNYHIMAENMVIEVVPTDIGEPLCGEVLITDLNNRLMPLIRYRLGDCVALRSGVCKCGRGLSMIGSVFGRTLSQYFYLPDGRRVHAYIFDYYMNKVLEAGVDIKQILFEQRERGAIVISVVLGNDSRESRALLSDKLNSLIIPQTGPRVKVELQVLERIPREPGKKLEYFQPLQRE